MGWEKKGESGKVLERRAGPVVPRDPGSKTVQMSVMEATIAVKL